MFFLSFLSFSLCFLGKKESIKKTGLLAGIPAVLVLCLLCYAESGKVFIEQFFAPTAWFVAFLAGGYCLLDWLDKRTTAKRRQGKDGCCS